MNIRVSILTAALGLGLAACTTTTPSGTGDTVTRSQSGTSPVAILASDSAAAQAVAMGKSPVTVQSLNVVVPSSLTVSEANRYIPSVDIVWRGDPIGDRYVQVQKIVQDAMSRGVQTLNGPIPVDVAITVTKFHALTEKARYSTGGVHAISFNIELKDARTGAVLVPSRAVRADLDGFGGDQAIAAEAAGQTQKVRISDHLAFVIQKELTDPDGYKNARLGLIQALNYP